MQKYRRFLVWGINFALSFSLLLSCGVSKTGDSQAFAAAPREKKSLQMWEYLHPDLDDGLDEILMEYTDKTGLDVTREHAEPSQLRDDYLQMALAGDGPDVVWIPSDSIGYLKAANTVLTAEAIFPAEFFTRFTEASLSHVRLEGKVAGIPVLRGNSLCLIYNKDLVPEPPATWEQLVEVSQKFKGEDRYGLVYNLSSPFFFAPYYLGYGGAVFKEGYQPDLDNQAMVNALSFVSKMKFEEKIIYPKGDSNTANRLFKAGKALFLVNGPWAFKGFTGTVNFGVTKLPPYKGVTPRPFTSAGTLLANKTLEKDPLKLEAFRRLADYLTTKEIQVRLASLAKEEPAVAAATNAPELNEDPLLAAYLEQVRVGFPMPNIPEMRLIWLAIQGPLDDVMFGNLNYKALAADMQARAVKSIAEFSQK